MVSNIDINNILKDVKSFQGCYSSNKLPQVKQKQKWSFITNLSKYGEAGTHWIAIGKFKKRIIYFDSFGLQPSGLILRYLKNNFPRFFYSSLTIQHPFSLSCGFFVICFCIINELNISFDDFIKKFSRTNLYNNDKVIVKWINKLTKNKYY